MRAIALLPSLLFTAAALNGVIAADQMPDTCSVTPAQRAAANVMMRIQFQPHRFVLMPQDPPPAPAAVPVVDEAPLIQIALLLDTSNSMDGLINQARSQLWAIVNSLGPVDAVECKAVDLAALPAADLPEGLRSLTPEQRAAYIAGKLAERRKIQERIQLLTVERERFLATKRGVDAPALDDAIIASVRDQAKRRGFLFP